MIKVDIGPCTLYHGDALDVLPTLPVGSITGGLLTDPPYSSGGAFRGDRTQSTVAKYVKSDTQIHHNEFGGDTRDQRSFFAWSTLWLCAAFQATAPGAVAAIFSDWRQLPVMTDALQAGGWVWRNLATWWKPGIRMQKGRFSSSAEYVVYGTAGAHDSEASGSPQNVFTCPPIIGEGKFHTAEKPVEVMRWLLQLVRPGGTVLDPFMGSGTTAVACVLTGHPFVGVEAGAREFDTACQRIEAALQQWPLAMALADLTDGAQGVFHA